ncbi:DUF3137 domain-containing protein [Scytonema sp. NUACC26]|uniref:DUF3137 domain-containing protein n=1 Tax=Scytonema sp. NUACC26 TaxID=3140176 RepID=UPI0034DC9EC1
MSEDIQLLTRGYEALKLKQYAEAVYVLEQFCQKVELETQHYFQAQRCLVKAYLGNGQLESAIALCQQMANSEHKTTQIWGQQFLTTLQLNNQKVISKVFEKSTSPSEDTSQEESSLVSENHIEARFKLRSLTEFKRFCQENLLNDLRFFEDKRIQVFNSIAIGGVIFLGTLFCFVLFFPVILSHLNSLEYWLDINIYKLQLSIPTVFIILFFNYLVVLFFVCWIWIAFYSSAMETYGSGFKSQIIEKIFNFVNINKTLEYSNIIPITEIEQTKAALIQSQIFQTFIKPNQLLENNRIFGHIDETLICFSEIYAELEVNHSWTKYIDINYFFGLNEENLIVMDSLESIIISCARLMLFLIIFIPFTIYILFLVLRLLKTSLFIINTTFQGKKIDYKRFEKEVLINELSRKKIFTGIFFRAEFNKRIKGKTIVLPNKLSSNLKTLNLGTSELINLEDSEFSKLFTVYGDDQVEARYILSTNLMAKLVKFRQKAQKNIYVSFVENTIYIAIEYPEDIFEPKLFHSMFNFTPLKGYFENIQLMLGIVEDLNLNRYIWGNPKNRG